ncbi:MAG: hypothetical protein LBL31_04795 [Spirochaetaceae bacterium]|nr:hypothetical protein [Spirochaetaceae bacterium]
MATGTMTAQENTGAGKFISLEQFLAAMDRIAANAAEQQKEAAERHAELERVLRENAEQMKETDKKIKKLSENIGGLNNSLGSIIETLVAARLWEKFKLYNLNRGFQRVPIFDEKGRGLTDIDILLSDTDCAIAVEVKTSLNRKDYVDRHVERMELIRQYPPAEVAINGKRVMGAMAGGVVVPSVMEYAHKCGFFVLELSGESAQLAESPEGFKPKVW